MDTFTEQELSLAEFCLDTTLKKGASKVRVTLEKNVMNLVGTLNGEVDKVTHCLDRSITLSIFADGRYGSYSTNRLDPDTLSEFIGKALATTRMLAPDPCRDLPDPGRIAKDAVSGLELGLYDKDYENLTAGDRVGYALGASIFRERSKECSIISEETEYSDNLSDTLIIDSNGAGCRHIETSFDFGADVTVENDKGDKFSGYWWESSPMLKELKISGCSAKALEMAVAQIGPQNIPGGKYTMVVDRNVASRLVTPVLSALSAYSIQQNNSFLAGTAGTRAFPEALTITETCRTAGQGGTRLFDSEGVATTEHPIIESGIVKEYFINTYMSAKMGLPPTCEDALRPRLHPWPEAGLTRSDILVRCGEGILVTGFNGGNRNSSTGDFSYGVEGFYFRDGKIVHPVREMVITGNFLDLWKGLIFAGDDIRPCMSKLIPTLAFQNIEFST